MSRYTPQEVAQMLADGLLSFPVTHFDSDLAFDEPAFRDNLEWLSGYPAPGLFAPGGTGEFFSLGLEEVNRVTKAAVEVAGKRTLVIGAAGYGTSIAVEMAQAAERAGADAILLLPPYLTEAPSQGIAERAEQVCRATSLGVIVYGRANGKLAADDLARVAERCPNLIGYKDGIGDIDRMTRIYSQLGDRLFYIGGLPTAETFALPYLEMGVTTYSSAIFNFLPEWALEFYAAVRARDHAKVYRELNDFVLPYTQIRNRCPGYAVSIVKAGMRAVGRSAGPVRSPLIELSDSELEELTALIGDRR
ncbi:5-dehydro-4-deoxyglucarate dehydratase [Carnimonas nigrificans]|uniref:5-dehydro-4-deoxyglucarate dehydratase n=1 Tax=Carnimonas nigrificans TaxID=64323 RepID=UPI00047044F0|nr:5-dehydro-4-deoxyglucarate dehydratase [Carnimonas nigrificans]